MPGACAYRFGFCLASLVVAMLAQTHAQAMPRQLVALATIDPSIVQQMRYAGTNNLTGAPLPGYKKAACWLTPKAAHQLAAAQAVVRKHGLSLQVYDCYRPVRAAKALKAWAAMPGPESGGPDEAFLAGISRKDVFRRGYFATRSAHSRGSTVDVALIPYPAPAILPHGLQRTWGRCDGPIAGRTPDISLDFGTSYDCLGPKAHTTSPDIDPSARALRLLLVRVMFDAGFINYKREWWHFRLKDEPEPKVAYDAVID